MAGWDDVRRPASVLPDVEGHPTRGGHPAWRAREKTFVGDPPLRRSDRLALGSAAPDEGEPPLGLRVLDEGVEATYIAEEPDVFTTPQFDGYPAVLVRLARIDAAELAEDAWSCRAPRRLPAELERGVVDRSRNVFGGAGRVGGLATHNRA